jgi:hypothetical protein
MPPLVRRCIDTWRRHNPTYRIIVLNARTFVEITGYRHMHRLRKASPALISDHVRLEVLRKFGGIWMDASCICTQSLEWVHREQKRSRSELVAFTHWTTASHPILENFFLAAVPGSPFVRAWSEEMRKVRDGTSIEDYMARVKTEKPYVDSSKLDNKLPYLVAYLCAAVVQEDPQNKATYRLSLSPSLDGPYKWVSKDNWDVEKSLCTLIRDASASDVPLVKFHNTVRTFIEKRGRPRSCREAAHPDVLYVLGH